MFDVTCDTEKYDDNIWYPTTGSTQYPGMTVTSDLVTNGTLSRTGFVGHVNAAF